MKKFFRDGLNRWISFWIKKNNIKPNEGFFEIKYKEFDIPKEWEKDALINMINVPWNNIGRISYTNKNKPLIIKFNDLGLMKLGQKTVHKL